MIGSTRSNSELWFCGGRMQFQTSGLIAAAKVTFLLFSFLRSPQRPIRFKVCARRFLSAAAREPVAATEPAILRLPATARRARVGEFTRTLRAKRGRPRVHFVGGFSRATCAAARKSKENTRSTTSWQRAAINILISAVSTVRVDLSNDSSSIRVQRCRKVDHLPMQDVAWSMG